MARLAEIKQQERETRRRLILAAAQALFARKDFKTVTVREIARTAGVSIGTIYNYYENLDELFLDVFVDGVKEIISILDKERTGDRPCSLDRLCEVYIGYLNDNMTFYQMMSHFMLGGKLSDDATDRLNRCMREVIDRVAATVQAAAIESDTRLTAQAIFSALNGIMISYATYPGRRLDEIRHHTVRLAKVMAALFGKQAGRI